MEDKYLLTVKDLKMYFNVNSGLFSSKQLKAVDGVTFSIKKGETLGLVGESGCGKTTVGRSIMHLYKPTGGEIVFNDRLIKSNADIKFLRSKMQMVFQDPYSSLDPRMTVGDIIGEPLDVHNKGLSKSEKSDRIKELMDSVGLSSEHATRYVHEFSGGQRQRIGIARALAMDPDMIICDEPVSALDVSIQAQVINMFEDLQRDRELTYLFIAHDISVVKHISDRIAVMYLGRMVEIADANELYHDPRHPYSQSLLSAVPIADPKEERARQRIVLEGDVPSPLNMPSGCPFRTRCKYAQPDCAEAAPGLTEISPGHFVACHHHL
ncbi:MAG: ATP-binding cassette domain-containing protein [Lachnospiraceae bacterium]|nr:ATP-binding cassette domain-containing protein [Lachnospiraceae bacterium]